MLLVSFRNPRRLRRGYQRELRLLKSEISSSKDKLFSIKHIATGLTQAKLYLVQVDMDHYDPIEMNDSGVYRCGWYIRHHKDCTHHRTLECRFWPEILKMKQDVTHKNKLPVIPHRVNGFLHRYQKY